MKNDNIVVLTDEHGKDIEFELLDVVTYEGNDYIVLCCIETMDEEGGEVTILRIQDAGDEENYVGVEEEEILDAVFNLFVQRCE